MDKLRARLDYDLLSVSPLDSTLSSMNSPYDTDIVCRAVITLMKHLLWWFEGKDVLLKSGANICCCFSQRLRGVTMMMIVSAVNTVTEMNRLSLPSGEPVSLCAVTER